MKKNMVRILAFVLVLILSLGALPLNALAYDIHVGVYDTQKQSYASQDTSLVTSWIEHTNAPTIHASNYNSHIFYNGVMYDNLGFWVQDNYNYYEEFRYSSSVGFTDALTVAFLDYGLHSHKLSNWYSDGTTHWRECLVCKKYPEYGVYEQFMYQNWHSDGDEDRICDVCGGDIPYHEIEVEDTKGGKITVELEEAPYRKKIVANVEPEEGYKLKKIHFIKVRDNGTEQEITRRKTTKSSWWTYMPTYDLKVTAEFVKTKK